MEYQFLARTVSNIEKRQKIEISTYGPESAAQVLHKFYIAAHRETALINAAKKNVHFCIFASDEGGVSPPSKA